MIFAGILYFTFIKKRLNSFALKLKGVLKKNETQGQDFHIINYRRRTNASKETKKKKKLHTKKNKFYDYNLYN